MIPSHNLTILIKESHSLAELRKLGRDYKDQLEAIHDCLICIACFRLLGGDIDDDDGILRNEAIKIYLISLRNWLNRAFGSYGRNARGCSNIMHAGAKLLHVEGERVPSLFLDLCDVAISMADDFDPQGQTSTRASH